MLRTKLVYPKSYNNLSQYEDKEKYPDLETKYSGIYKSWNETPDHVKAFFKQNPTDYDTPYNEPLDKVINTFLDTIGIAKLIDIKYSTCESEGAYQESALIIYDAKGDD